MYIHSKRMNSFRVLLINLNEAKLLHVTLESLPFSFMKHKSLTLFNNEGFKTEFRVSKL